MVNDNLRHCQVCKTSALTLASYQIDIPSVNKYNVFVKSFKIKVSGAKIYIPLSNKLIVLYGFFSNDQLQILILFKGPNSELCHGVNKEPSNICIFRIDTICL